MSHVLTTKIPEALLERLQETSHRAGKSKGALVREALEGFLESRKGAEEDDERIRKATEAMRLGKKIRVRVDWEALRRKAAVPSPLSPEEEVLEHRRRHL